MPTRPVRPDANQAAALERRVLHRPSIFDILYQSKRDFIGKDVQQNTTYTYVWQADQAGHFMLGFAPSFVIVWVAQFLEATFGWATALSGPRGLLWAAIAMMCVWTALELYDLFDSYRMWKVATGYFAFNLGNLVWNVITALIYFLLGAAVAAISVFGAGYVLAAIVVLGVLQFFFVGVWWLRIKIVFQQAGLPYLYRLANFSGRFAGPRGEELPKGSPDLQKVLSFVNEMKAAPSDTSRTHTTDELEKRHLIITGPLNSGKSSLAAGIGTEFAFDKGIGRYVTMSELVQVVQTPKPVHLEANQRDVSKPAEQEFNDGRILWQWPSVDLLIIDDVVELLLPLRRYLERNLDGELGRYSASLIKDQELMKLLGEPNNREAVVKYLMSQLGGALKDLASSKTVVDFVVMTYEHVLATLDKIPRVVWVINPTIKPDLFEGFIRDRFKFVDGRRDRLLTVELMSLQQTPGAHPAGVPAASE
jgi:hypothetical protein